LLKNELEDVFARFKNLKDKPAEFQKVLPDVKSAFTNLVKTFLKRRNFVAENKTEIVETTQKAMEKTLAVLGEVKSNDDFVKLRKVKDAIILAFTKNPPVKRELFNRVKAEAWGKYYYGFSSSDTQLIFAVGLAVFAFVMIFAGRWQDKQGPRLVAIVGGVILGLGYILAGAVSGTNHLLMLIFIGIFGGAGIGLGYVCPIAAGNKWFPDKKGLITGLAVAGFGAGALIFVKLAGAWANLIYDVGVNQTFFIYGIIFAIAVIVGALFLSNPPKDWKPTGWEPLAVAKKTGLSTYDFNYRQMLKTRQFYFLWITFILSAGAGLMVIGNLKNFGYFEGGLTLAEAGTALAMLAIFNGLGRIVWGWLSDKIGRKLAINLMVLLQGLMLIGILFIGKTVSGLTLAACWIGFNFGGNFALFPAATADYFGLKNLGTNYGWVFTAYGVGGIFGPILAGKIYDITGSYSLAFIILAVLLGVAWILTILYKTPKAPETETAGETKEQHEPAETAADKA